MENKESNAIKIIEKVLSIARNPGAGFSGGKDSTVLLDLIRRTSGNKITIPILHIDTTAGCEIVHNFVDKMRKLWKFKPLLRDDGKPFSIEEIQTALHKFGIDYLFLAVRGDESGKKVIHTGENIKLVYPLRDFSEVDIWTYIRQYNLPYCFLYDKGYKSIRGLSDDIIQKNVKSRQKIDKDIEEKLRYLGYM